MFARLLAGALMALAIFVTLPVRAEPEAAPPLQHFFENNAFSGAVLSPDGRRVAVRMHKPGRRDFLAVINLDTKKATVAAEYTDYDIDAFEWVNDERLIFTITDLAYASEDREHYSGMSAVNADGSKLVVLVNHRADSPYHRPAGWTRFLLNQRGSQDSEWLYVGHAIFDKEMNQTGMGLVRLNTLTGAAERVNGPGGTVHEYYLDAQGKPRLAVRYQTKVKTLFYVDPASNTWRELGEYPIYARSRDDVEPVGFAPDGSLYVTADGGEDFSTMRKMDLATGKPGQEAVVATPGYDFAGNLITTDDKLLGVRLTTDATNNVWFDPAMQAMQTKINQALPRTINLLKVPVRPGSPWVLVSSYSDTTPFTYRLYDTRTGEMELVGASFPKIDPALMGRQKPVRFKARDGMEIPALLTLPGRGAATGLPLIVLVHGGPWVRGSTWGWDAETQFLASRGYAVLEVEFRGGTGLGHKHFAAGFKQWGLAMQNDLADGVRWAVSQGIADQRRVCIAGASYGGYATLMGLVKDHELYQCGISWLGVTDIPLLFNGTWFARPNFNDATVQNVLAVRIGDPEKDAEQLKATSPLLQAARIRRPLFIAHGGQDRVVPYHHFREFYDAVKTTNRQVDKVVYQGEGHGWSLAKNRIDFWQRVERFLDKHIGPASLNAPVKENGR